MIDLETRSDADISKTGVYRYADSPYFDILLFACSVDDGEVQVYDLANGEQLPEKILSLYLYPYHSPLNSDFSYLDYTSSHWLCQPHTASTWEIISAECSLLLKSR